MAVSKIRRHKPEWGSLDHCLDDPHREGSENLPPAHRGLRPGGSSLSGHALVEHWPCVRVSFCLTRSLKGDVKEDVSSQAT